MNDFQRFVTSAFTIAEMEARKIRHDSTELWMRTIQPALWLLIFGEVFNSLRGLAPGGYSYIQYIAPGVLAQSVLFVAIFYGITIVWERDVGLLTKLLSTPTPRTSVVVGKALAAGVRGIFQAVMIFALALIIGVNLRLDLLDVAGVFVVVVLFAMCFASFSMTLASFLKTRDRMMGIGQAITIPLFFGSNAIYPVSLMPTWLQAVSRYNPLSYVVDAMRSMLLTGDYSGLPVDMLALLVSTVFLIACASISLKRLIE
ncbi:MAG TPA: ABC transporter permease [Nitrososphaerales archaeon]|nr:ABC transporter permease [Nitrososphaerales archaeon]